MNMLTKSMTILVALGALVSIRAEAQAVGQADVQIQSLTVTPARSLRAPGRTLPTRIAPPGGIVGPTPLPASDSLDINVVVFSWNDDDAQNVKLNIFLPPESHVLGMPAECAAPVSNPGATGVSNAFVTCTLGSMAVNAARPVRITIARPVSYVVPRVGVFAWSETPDPNTANNHAEAVAP
jgi:hypothetical protein